MPKVEKEISEIKETPKKATAKAPKKVVAEKVAKVTEEEKSGKKVIVKAKRTTKSTKGKEAVGKVYNYGTGKRKTAIAKVFLSKGNGNITVNGKPLDKYFGRNTSRIIVVQPLVVTNTEGKFDIKVTTLGGGNSGQAGAIRHGIARALLDLDAELYRAPLKKAGLLTRDSRIVERKKVGLHKARKATQYSKR